MIITMCQLAKYVTPICDNDIIILPNLHGVTSVGRPHLQVKRCAS